MRHITRDMAASIINVMPPTFDAHRLERRVLRTYPVAFAYQLLEFTTSQDPLHQFSAAFARWIDSEFRGEIRKTHKVNSDNLGGESSQNQEWERIQPGQPIAICGSD